MRKQLHYVTLCVLFLNANILFAENYVDLYINTYKDIAIREMMRSGIPASITIAQGIHESSWGRGTLAVKSNNHFGIKCKDYWKGDSFYYEDDDFDAQGKLIKSCFRAYENPEKSYIDHTDFLTSTAHYQELFSYSNTDYINWAKGLKRCGYATDKQYANKLIATIEKYQLNKFDFPLEEQMLVTAPAYNIPKKNVNDLLIKSEKEESVQYTEMDVPKAIAIPEDYQRRFEEVEMVVFEKPKPQPVVHYPAAAVEEIIPPKRETIVYEKETFEEYKTRPQPIKRDDYPVAIKRESIIPSKFASTSRTYQLARKPRTSNPSLR